MVLRVVIGLGLVMMLLGFGAAGLQYWEKRSTSAALDGAATGTTAPPVTQQSWLISQSGGVVPQADVQAYLVQDRFVESRTAFVTRSARLDELLLEGEKLPQEAYLQVLADIRAPMVAAKICNALLETIAVDCAINRARVVDGSVDPVAGEARFAIELVYRLKPVEQPLPDLATHVLMTKTISLDFEANVGGVPGPEALLASAADAAVAACEAVRKVKACRVLGLETTWYDNASGAARARIGWLAPLPEGMFPAPPLGMVGG